MKLFARKTSLFVSAVQADGKSLETFFHIEFSHAVQAISAAFIFPERIIWNTKTSNPTKTKPSSSKSNTKPIIYALQIQAYTYVRRSWRRTAATALQDLQPMLCAAAISIFLKKTNKKWPMDLSDTALLVTDRGEDVPCSNLTPYPVEDTCSPHDLSWRSY